MKVIAVLFASLSLVAAFAPTTFVNRRGTELAAAPKKAPADKKPLFDTVFGMDLFAPVADQNDYGARAKKNIKLGQIGANSYVPNGLTAAQYAKLRAEEAAKKEKAYKAKAAKAGKFGVFSEWLAKRGAPGQGHTYAKLKYSDNDGKKYDGIVK